MLKRKPSLTDKTGNSPREGDLYARISVGGCTFDLYYGYYEECDRQNPLVRPIPIYPDFVKQPQYDQEGHPFATDMQDVCGYYAGDSPDDGCFSCRHYRRAADFIGVCLCKQRQVKA